MPSLVFVSSLFRLLVQRNVKITVSVRWGVSAFRVNVRGAIGPVRCTKIVGLAKLAAAAFVLKMILSALPTPSVLSSGCVGTRSAKHQRPEMLVAPILIVAPPSIVVSQQGNVRPSTSVVVGQMLVVQPEFAVAISTH